MVSQFHRPTCVCPPGHYGNPSTECKLDIDDCSGVSCGADAVCLDRLGGYDCACKPGCTGNPLAGGGCVCPKQDPCLQKVCGRNAVCETNAQNIAECRCPASYPFGNGREGCTADGKNQFKLLVPFSKLFLVSSIEHHPVLISS